MPSLGFHWVFIDVVNSLLASTIPMFDMYYVWNRYNYSLGYFNPTFIKGSVVFIPLLFARKVNPVLW